MKKYLKEIETSGFILIFIGLLLSFLAKTAVVGFWIIVVGLFVLLNTFLYKAFRWSEYEKDNRRNLVIVLVTIAILILQMLMKR